MFKKMNIANNFSKLISIKLQQVKASCSFCGDKNVNSQPEKDCFVRSTNLIKQIIDKQRIEKLYDETYKEVINLLSKTNPIINNLNLNKPQIIIEKYSDSEKGGAYSFIDNTIGISKNAFDISSYIVGTVDKEGNLESYLGMTSENEKKDKLKQAQIQNKNATLIALTREEQDIYVKSMLAHEIRHFIQQHLIASTEGCGEEQKVAINKFLKPATEELKKIREEYIKLCKESGVEQNKNTEKPENNYYETYRAKTMLPTNAKIKFSLFSDDNRYWSVKDHLLKSQLDSIEGKGTVNFDDNYYASSLEIDAYNFEKEFLYMYANDAPNVRKNIILSFTFKPEEYCSRGVELMRKNGISFITE